MAGELTVAAHQNCAAASRQWITSHRWLFFGCLLYFGTGVAFYMTVEGWNVCESLYFLMVTASTVGYGDMNPGSDTARPGSLSGSRVFTIFYIFFGITVVFAQLSTLIAEMFNPLFRKATQFIERSFPQETIDLDGDGGGDFKLPRAPHIYYTKSLMPPLVVITVFQVIFAALFVAVEPDLNFGTALYHCIVTATTVGYGDVSIQTDGGRMYAFVHILFSVSLLAALISSIGELSSARELQLRKMKLLQGTFDTDLMVSLDEDGDGVDKFEFVVGMLTKLGQLDQADVDLFTKLFAKLDTDNNKRLTRADFEAGREQATNKLAVVADHLKAVHETIGETIVTSTATTIRKMTSESPKAIVAVQTYVDSPQTTTEADSSRGRLADTAERPKLGAQGSSKVSDHV